MLIKNMKNNKLNELNDLSGYSNYWYKDVRGNNAYSYVRNGKNNRGGNRSLQRNPNHSNMNPHLLNRNGHNQLNQSVEGVPQSLGYNMRLVNSKFSPHHKFKSKELVSINKINSNIKINSEADDVVMPLATYNNSQIKMKGGRMCSTLNNFNKSVKNAGKKVGAHSPDHEYAGNSKIISDMIGNMHPYLQDKSAYQSRCASDLQFGWKNGSKGSQNGTGNMSEVKTTISFNSK